MVKQLLNIRGTFMMGDSPAFSGLIASSTSRRGLLIGKRSPKPKPYGNASARLVTKAVSTSETPEPPQTPSRQLNPRKRGFLKGTRAQPRSCTVAGQFFTVFFWTQKDEVPASATLSQARQSDGVMCYGGWAELVNNEEHAGCLIA